MVHGRYMTASRGELVGVVVVSRPRALFTCVGVANQVRFDAKPYQIWLAIFLLGREHVTAL